MKNIDLVVLGEVALDVVLAGVDKIPRRWSEVGNVNAYSHIRASLLGANVTVPLQAGEMMLGARQNI
jgi:thiamine phosphate synthase YjbQ (UPF0047 family)